MNNLNYKELMVDYKELVLAVCGPVDAGKSSLIGVLTSGKLDDGRGLARNKVLVHPHERESGKTSHITYNPLIYKKIDNKINLVSLKEKNTVSELFSSDSQEECLFNSKIISFIDLAGHEKYLKTTIFGVTGLFPDYGIVVIGANTGITKLTKEHLGILLYLKVPFIITITKIDLAPTHIYQNLCNQLKALLGRKTFGKVLYFVSTNNSDNEVNHYIKHMINNSDIIPIISVSNKEGNNINNLHKILYTLPIRDKWADTKTDGTIFYIDNNYMIPGIGLVLSGTNKGKPIKIKQKMYLGPFAKTTVSDKPNANPLEGYFKEIVIKTIHNNIRQNVNELEAGLPGSVSFKITSQKDDIERKMIKKGMVIIDDLNKFKNNVSSSFYAKINVLHHATTIKEGYSPVIHCGPIRQTAKIEFEDDTKTILRSGDNKVVKVNFTYHPEFIEENMIFFFRDGTTKGVGQVLKLN
jgi:GTPase